MRQNEESLVAAVTALTNDTSAPIALNGLSYDEIEHWGPEDRWISWSSCFSVLETYSDVVAESQATGEIARAESEFVSAQAVLQDRHVSFQQVALRASRLKQLSDAAIEGSS